MINSMKQEDIQKTLETLGKSGITVVGDLVVGEKHVENEVANVESGGIGIQIVNGKENAPLTVSDKEIKSALEEMFKVTDDEGVLFFRNKKQWWAVYRVLSTFCNYPKKMTLFVAKINDLELDYAGNTTTITYDSLSAAPKDVPLMSCSPAAWGTLKDVSDNYKQQYDVAEFLMQKLGIKS